MHAVPRPKPPMPLMGHGDTSHAPDDGADEAVDLSPCPLLDLRRHRSLARLSRAQKAVIPQTSAWLKMVSVARGREARHHSCAWDTPL
jgi:hypothetical protein